MKESPIIDLAKWHNKLPQMCHGYMNADPFPHIIIDGFCDERYLHQVCQAFPDVIDDRWIHYIHYNEKKHGLNRFEVFPDVISDLITELNCQEFVSLLSGLTGVAGLFGDPELEGGGLHQSTNGGFLRIHSDFSSHPHHPDWRRRVNVLIYLNPDWEEAYGGQLELWTPDMARCAVSIIPSFNRCVIFNTNETSYHGHPEPLICPSTTTRKSIALYYYTKDHSGLARATTYVARPQDRSRRFRIGLDNFALRLYHWMKQMFGIRDGLASKMLAFLTKWNK